MTVGTAIVVSVGLLCVTFIVALCIGASLQKQKSKAASQLTQVLTDEISSKIKGAINKK